jgi:hypothetical protein
MLSPVGRVVNRSGALATGLVNGATITFGDNMSEEYCGAYHGYLRVYQANGVAGDASARIQLVAGGNIIYTSGTVYTSVADATEVLDMGNFIFPGNVSAKWYQPQIYIWGGTGGGGNDLYLIDFWMFPTDEWFALYTGGTDVSAYTFDINSLQYFKNDKLAQVLTGTGSIYSTKQAITSSPPVVQANTNQRLWFANVDDPEIHFCHKIYMTKSQRYFSMRGGR